jgi:hypothetical protein
MELPISKKGTHAMTRKDHENRFIEQFKKKSGSPLSWEVELALRVGFAAGASIMGDAAWQDGYASHRTEVLNALGAVARKDKPLP